MDPDGIPGEWSLDQINAALQVTIDSAQTIPNPNQRWGVDPASGAINITGTVTDSMEYMLLQSMDYYGYNVTQLIISNNPVYYLPVDEYYYEEPPEDAIYPIYGLLYMTFSGNEFGEFIIADTVNGELDVQEFEVPNAADVFSIDTTTFRVDIAEFSIAGNVISGSLAYEMIDILADTPTIISIPTFEGTDIQNERLQFYENGSGYDIVTYNDFYYPYVDTSEFSWTATEDSLTIVFLYDEPDTISMSYVIEENMMYFNFEQDYCADYYYTSCAEELEYMYGLVNVEEALLILNIELSYIGPLGIDDQVYAPDGFKILNVFPNPFNPVTTLQYSMNSSGLLSIQVYDLNGREIRSLYDGVQSSGFHEIRWDGKDEHNANVSSGVYLFKLESAGVRSTAKVLLLK